LNAQLFPTTALTFWVFATRLVLLVFAKPEIPSKIAQPATPLVFATLPTKFAGSVSQTLIVLPIVLYLVVTTPSEDRTLVSNVFRTLTVSRTLIARPLVLPEFVPTPEIATVPATLSTNFVLLLEEMDIAVNARPTLTVLLVLLTASPPRLALSVASNVHLTLTAKRPKVAIPSAPATTMEAPALLQV